MWKHTLPMLPTVRGSPRGCAFEAGFFEKVFFRVLCSIPTSSMESESEHFKKASCIWCWSKLRSQSLLGREQRVCWWSKRVWGLVPSLGSREYTSYPGCCQSLSRDLRPSGTLQSCFLRAAWGCGGKQLCCVCFSLIFLPRVCSLPSKNLL